MDTLSYLPLEEINRNGFILDVKLTEEELVLIKKEIKQSIENLIKTNHPEYFDMVKALDLREMHKISDYIDHQSFWSKKRRLFNPSFVERIRDMLFFQKLEKMFGRIKIADEERVFPEEIYWRYVRPHKKEDIGPLHADAWFWNLGHGKMLEGYFRLKIWISVCCPNGGNGLRIVPGSHKENYQYTAALRDGFMKPNFDESLYDLNVIALDSHPGDTVIFHDRLLHGGCLNNGDYSRFSFEFTMLLKQ